MTGKVKYFSKQEKVFVQRRKKYFLKQEKSISRSRRKVFLRRRQKIFLEAGGKYLSEWDQKYLSEWNQKYFTKQEKIICLNETKSISRSRRGSSGGISRPGVTLDTGRPWSRHLFVGALYCTTAPPAPTPLKDPAPPLPLPVQCCCCCCCCCTILQLSVSSHTVNCAVFVKILMCSVLIVTWCTSVCNVDCGVWIVVVCANKYHKYAILAHAPPLKPGPLWRSEIVLIIIALYSIVIITLTAIVKTKQS